MGSTGGVNRYYDDADQEEGPYSPESCQSAYFLTIVIA